MTEIRNVSPYGDLYIPAFDETVGAGEVVDVPDTDAADFLAQPFNWEAVTTKKQKTAPVETDTAAE